MKKYLIIKLAAIGDVIMALPMIDEIRKNNEFAHITWVCGQSVKPILECFSIDKLIVIDEKKILTGNKVDKIIEVIKLWEKIAFHSYDLIAVGHGARQYRLLTLLTKGKVKKNFSHVMGRMCPIPSRNHSDEYVRLVHDSSDIIKCNFITPTKLILKSNEVVDEIKRKCVAKGRIVILSPGGAKNIIADDSCRRWPINRYVELAQRLINNGDNVVVIGGLSDRWIESYFEGLDYINAIGKTTLLELISLFNQADVFVTHDSGPLHLAGLTNVNIIALFGPTNPWEKISPQGNVKVIWEHYKYACCPCYDGKYYACCEDNICLNNINVQTVLDLM